MPTYEYACSSCKHEWELGQSIQWSPITECPSCHNETAKRQISRGTGFILKGSGWYADLYSSSSNKPAASGGSSSSSEGTSGSSSGSASGTSSSSTSGGSSGSSDSGSNKGA